MVTFLETTRPRDFCQDAYLQALMALGDDEETARRRLAACAPRVG